MVKNLTQKVLILIIGLPIPRAQPYCHHPGAQRRVIPKLYCLFSTDNKRLRTPFDPLNSRCLSGKEGKKEGPTTSSKSERSPRHALPRSLALKSAIHVMTSHDCDVIAEPLNEVEEQKEVWVMMGGICLVVPSGVRPVGSFERRGEVVKKYLSLDILKTKAYGCWE